MVNLRNLFFFILVSSLAIFIQLCIRFNCALISLTTCRITCAPILRVGALSILINNIVNLLLLESPDPPLQCLLRPDIKIEIRTQLQLLFDGVILLPIHHDHWITVHFTLIYLIIG